MVIHHPTFGVSHFFRIRILWDDQPNHFYHVSWLCPAFAFWSPELVSIRQVSRMSFFLEKTLYAKDKHDQWMLMTNFVELCWIPYMIQSLPWTLEHFLWAESSWTIPFRSFCSIWQDSLQNPKIVCRIWHQQHSSSIQLLFYIAHEFEYFSLIGMTWIQQL